MQARSPMAMSDIFHFVLEKGRRFFGDVGGLPNLRGFLSDENNYNVMRSLIERHWDETVTEAQKPLVVNILINPTLFFCKRDSLDGQYSRYFRPIYLFNVDGATDPVQIAVRHMNEQFESHYEQRIEARPYRSLNDIEALLRLSGTGNGGTLPFPPASTVVSIEKAPGCIPGFKVLIDGSDYWPIINDIIIHDRERRLLLNYFDGVTPYSASYHHVTVGGVGDWMARIYIAFRKGDAQPLDKSWMVLVKDFAFGLGAAVALAGTFIRNPSIVSMLNDVQASFYQIRETQRRHAPVFRQFIGATPEVNRAALPYDLLERTIKTIVDERPAGFELVQEHLTRSSCATCNQKTTEPLIHALGHCNTLGEQLCADITTKIRKIQACEHMRQDVTEYLAYIVMFGLTGDALRPAAINTYFNKKITANWLKKCQSAVAVFDNDDIQPFVRGLMSMVGNVDMVKNDLPKLSTDLQISTDAPEDSIDFTHHRNSIVAIVRYAVKGTDLETGRLRAQRNADAKLHVFKNELLWRYGELFLNDFSMYIDTTLDGHSRCISFGAWQGNYEGKDGFITYGFQFGK